MTASTETNYPFYDWRGTAYEIGVQHGRALSREIVAEAQPALEQSAALTGDTASRFLARFAEQYEPMFRRYAPQAIEEIRGLASGSGLDYGYAFFAATRDGAKLPEPLGEACTAFYCAANVTADGHIYIGQTKDTSSPLSRYHIMRRTYNDPDGGRRAVLTLNYPGWIANIGLNSHGVGCAGNSLYARPAEIPTAPFSLVRYLIAAAESVEQIAGLLDELPMENGCMTVADAHGRAICIESVAGRRDCRDISGLAFGHANSVLCQRLAADEDEAKRSPSSPTRQCNIEKRLEETRGRLDGQMLKSILSDHTDLPNSICLHQSARGAVTTAALIADCTSKTAFIAIGNPCTHPFVGYAVTSS